MLRRTPRTAVALLAAASLAPITAITAIPSAQAGVIPLKNAAMITKTDRGYVFRAGQQDSHLVVQRVRGGLRFADRGTRELRSYPDACRKQKVRRGVAAICKVPGRVSARRPMKLQVWPRLGDDFVDASGLSAAFRFSILADAGRDVIRLGAGDDFVNGAQDSDWIRGGAGNDWVRTGLGHDVIKGGTGRDRLVGVEGSDSVRGGGGDDRVGGGPGSDRLYGGTGRDYVICGTGRDNARVERRDTVRQCESAKY